MKWATTSHAAPKGTMGNNRLRTTALEQSRANVGTLSDSDCRKRIAFPPPIKKGMQKGHGVRKAGDERTSCLLDFLLTLSALEFSILGKARLHIFE